MSLEVQFSSGNHNHRSIVNLKARSRSTSTYPYENTNSDAMLNQPEVFQGEVQEDVVLENLGYQPELKRSFSLLGMIGFSFSIVTCWTALSGVLIIGFIAGGPPVMIYSWIGICLFALAVAYSMAEICSAYPVAGGQYSWVAVLAPPKVARGMSWITGWFMITGMA